MHFFNVQLTFHIPYRDKIERLHSEEVTQRRRHYTKEHKDIIMRLLSAKEETSSSGIPKTSDKEPKEEKGQTGNITHRRESMLTLFVISTVPANC